MNPSVRFGSFPRDSPCSSATWGLVPVLVLAIAIGHAGAANWSQYKFSADHSGNNPDETAISVDNVSTLLPLWTVDLGSGIGLGGGIHSSIAVDGAAGVVYANSQNGYLFALDSATGATLWTGYTGGYGDSTPVLTNGLVVVGTIAGIKAFPSSCSTPCVPAWTADTGNTYNPSLTADAGVVYAAGYDGVVRALDASTGTLLWSALVNKLDPIFFSPSVANGIVYVTGDWGLYAFPVGCAGTCAPLWTSHTEISGSGSAAIVNGVAYLGIYDGTILAIDAATGVRIWTGQVAAGESSPAVANGRIYIGTTLGKLAVFSASGCGEARCKPAAIGLTGQSLFDPVVANGVVYVGSLAGFYTSGTVFAFSASCKGVCTPLWSAPVNGAIEAPVTVVNGVVYTATLIGSVEAFALPVP